MISALGTKADMCVAKGHVCFTPESRHWCCTNQCPLRAIADIQEVGVTNENPGALPGAWLSEYRFSEHSIRTLSNVCRVGRYSSAECRNSRDHYY
jgi:hypothetical protein